MPGFRLFVKSKHAGNGDIAWLFVSSASRVVRLFFYSNIFRLLFGEYFDIYIGMICTHYRIYKNDKDIPKYLKMHIDDGLEKIYIELEERPNIEGFDFLKEKLILNSNFNFL